MFVLVGAIVLPVVLLLWELEARNRRINKLLAEKQALSDEVKDLQLQLGVSPERRG